MHRPRPVAPWSASSGLLQDPGRRARHPPQERPHCGITGGERGSRCTGQNGWMAVGLKRPPTRLHVVPDRPCRSGHSRDCHAEPCIARDRSHHGRPRAAPYKIPVAAHAIPRRRGPSRDHSWNHTLAANVEVDALARTDGWRSASSGLLHGSASSRTIPVGAAAAATAMPSHALPATGRTMVGLERPPTRSRSPRTPSPAGAALPRPPCGYACWR